MLPETIYNIWDFYCTSSGHSLPSFMANHTSGVIAREPCSSGQTLYVSARANSPLAPFRLTNFHYSMIVSNLASVKT